MPNPMEVPRIESEAEAKFRQQQDDEARLAAEREHQAQARLAAKIRKDQKSI